MSLLVWIVVDSSSRIAADEERSDVEDGSDDQKPIEDAINCSKNDDIDEADKESDHGVGNEGTDEARGRLGYKADSKNGTQD